MGNVRQKDIAERLGVSMTTVSRALNGSGRVKKETCQRVMQLAQESHYMVNSLARSLRLSDTRTIGIVVPDISNSFFANIIKGAQGICHDRGYMLMVCNSDENPLYEEGALMALLEKQASGVIVASVGGSRETVNGYRRANIPVVYIDNVPSDAADYDLVSIDNYKAAYALTQIVVKRGYRKIGMITGHRKQSSARMRYEGFINALSDAEIPNNGDWIREGEFTLESGYAEMMSVLSLERRPAAMILSNNKLAYGAIRAIYERGLKIPEDVAIASFDAIDGTGLVRPQIVSLNQPAEEIGRRACQMIIDKLTGESSGQERHVFLEPFLSEGDSL